jgi:ABC-2 type transport system ATP-binding protein
MSAPVIEAKGLTKIYGGTRVVDGIDLSVAEGEVIGLLGPNGAGKTTTILMLLGLTESSKGEVRIVGKDPLREPLAVKSEAGYLPDSVGFYDNLSGRDNLRYTARLGGLDNKEADARMEEALNRVRLSDVGDKRVGTYSHGMRQRLGLAELLMRKTRIIILDEPTSGLDPQSTSELLDLIRSFAKDGMTIIVSSHLLDVVQSICTRIALFNKGRIGFVGTVDALAQKVTDGAYRVEVSAEGVDIEKLAGAIKGVTAAHMKGDLCEITASRDIRTDLAKRIIEAGGALKNLDARRVSLGEAYNLFFKEAQNAA